MLLVCGGGVRNLLLMECFNVLLLDWYVGMINDYGVDVDYVEVIVFVWLVF